MRTGDTDLRIMRFTVQTLFVVAPCSPKNNDQLLGGHLQVKSSSHEGHDDEESRGGYEADGEHGETDILRLLKVNSSNIERFLVGGKG